MKEAEQDVPHLQTPYKLLLALWLSSSYFELMKKFIVIPRTATRLLSMKISRVLSIASLLLCAARGEDPSVTFDNTPLLGMPLDARKQEFKELRSGDGSNTFRKITEGAIKGIRIRYFEKETWGSQAQVSKYLTGFLNYERIDVHNFEVWAQAVYTPEIECVIDFRKDHLEKLREEAVDRDFLRPEGRLLIWNSVACYRDATGKWFFLTLGDYFHGAHPDGIRELERLRVKETEENSSAD